MKTLRTVEDIIKALGGVPGVSRVTGANDRAVMMWRFKGVIPAKMYVLVNDALWKKDCVADRSAFGFADPKTGMVPASPREARGDEKRA